MRSAIRRHQPVQRTVLGKVDCFVQSEVVGSQIELVVSSSYLVAEPLESSWHLLYHPYVQYAQMWKEAVTGLAL